MKQRSDELVRFISRAFGAATIAIIVIVGVFLALFVQRGIDEASVRHSREISRLARQIEIHALKREATLRGHLAFGAPIAAAARGIGDRLFEARLDSLRRLTASEPRQKSRAERIATAFARWDSALAAPYASRPATSDLQLAVRQAVIDAEPIFAAISAEVSALLGAEQELHEERTDAAHRLDRVIVVSAVIALALMLVILYQLRRRMLSQAHEMSLGTSALDLRNAQLIDQTGKMEQMIDDLQASETRFRTLVESLHDVVFTLGHEKRYTGMYGGTATTSQQLGSYLGKTACEILGPVEGQVHMDAADRALRGETLTYEWTMMEGAERLHFTATVSPLRGPHGEIRGVVGINRDLTEQVRRDKALSEAREQLRQAQRLDALGQLAGGVAHDFNNLLTVIMTYAAILAEDVDPASDAAKSIEEISLASERAAALTRQLLAFSRRQVLKPRAIDLNDTVRDVERMLRRLLPPDITLEANLATSLGLVMADPGQVEQVLVNLAINARDAMPDGGRLTFSTANVERGEEASGGNGTGLRGPHVLVTVSDTGVGMSPETAAKVFEPFFTTKGFGKGTGLGLATVHGIIEQSGGRVSLESAPGRGTTFYIRLPRITDSEPAAPAAAPEPELRGSETILLVDDNEELRRVVKRMLSRAGYRVIEAASGAAAIAHLDRGSDVEIVLSDVMMPEMNGKAVVDAVRQRHRGVKLLLMSGYNYDTALRGMAQRGDVAFIEKPFTAEKLLQKLREVLGQPQERGTA
ncbi:MAG TPA: ATP-binding protein [Gemmatimonadaceae bacterium]|nr:ATP-binding protein [Gemmatimonadaceae bacterium]